MDRNILPRKNSFPNHKSVTKALWIHPCDLSTWTKYPLSSFWLLSTGNRFSVKGEKEKHREVQSNIKWQSFLRTWTNCRLVMLHWISSLILLFLLRGKEKPTKLLSFINILIALFPFLNARRGEGWKQL